ncbi:hypothetical protein DO97_16095 [Neosynechococcus sphagnicola sy1]|uniref:Glycosyltransferase 2-like domain-containing protein n=1 Tax=Neosynechococcus sphagnicola sy1 TaxID=1497020 RepID=A0A098TI90_9CYAN|nr:glycosyltransferase family 2 protein [Neosynechococcus sphagnicola]KGF71697.1 hypothetical protein DO97_16095 [Neosynechococcus sphagnicola sy1]
MSRSQPLISVVIPSYNDEPIIRPFYDAIVQTLGSQLDYGFELIYVDDGSVDPSPHTLSQLAKEDQRVTFIELCRNYGQQRALFAGLSVAKGDYVVTIDGDYQYPPEVILQLVQAMGHQYEMASGIRTHRRDNWCDILASKLGNLIIRKILAVNLQDFGSVKAFSRPLVDRILALRHYFSDVYPIALSLHPTFVEVKVLHKQRPSGRSHWNLWMRLKLYLYFYIGYSDDHFQIPFFSRLPDYSGRDNFGNFTHNFQSNIRLFSKSARNHSPSLFDFYCGF